ARSRGRAGSEASVFGSRDGRGTGAGTTGALAGLASALRAEAESPARLSDCRLGRTGADAVDRGGGGADRAGGAWLSGARSAGRGVSSMMGACGRVFTGGLLVGGATAGAVDKLLVREAFTNGRRASITSLLLP